MRPKVAFNGHWRFLVLTGGGHFWQHSQMEHQNIQEGITFDDVLLVPQYSDLAPSDTVTSTRLTRNDYPQYSACLGSYGHRDGI